MSTCKRNEYMKEKEKLCAPVHSFGSGAVNPKAIFLNQHTCESHPDFSLCQSKRTGARFFQELKVNEATVLFTR